MTILRFFDTQRTDPPSCRGWISSPKRGIFKRAYVVFANFGGYRIKGSECRINERGVKMRYEADVKDLLINNAIHLIAEGGFEKATTKELAHSGGSLPDLKMNEVYIYRYFGSKERLYEAAFILLDKELFYSFRNELREIGGVEHLTKETLYEFFLKAWKFILGNEERCRCYVRYYYSIYFKGRSAEEHRRLFDEIISELAPAFRDEADVAAILHSVFTALCITASLRTVR